MTCANSKDADQPAHPRSLVRDFSDRMCLVQPPGYPKRDERKLSYRVDVQADLSHTGLIVSVVVRWLISMQEVVMRWLISMQEVVNMWSSIDEVITGIDLLAECLTGFTCSFLT